MNIDLEILASVFALEPNAYAVAIRKHLATYADKDVSYGRLYGLLSNLEEAGLVRSQTEPGGPERRGHPRLVYWLTEDGRKAKSEGIASSSAGHMRELDGAARSTGETDSQ